MKHKEYIKGLYEDVKNIKTNIWNNNKEFMIKEVYSQSSREDFLTFFDMIVRDVDKILDKLRFETRPEFKNHIHTWNKYNKEHKLCCSNFDKVEGGMMI